jgi:formiminoglutamase
VRNVLIFVKIECMKDISIYFQPILTESENRNSTIGSVISTNTKNNFPDLVKGAIAFFVVPEFRNGGVDSAPNNDFRFREEFYQLHIGENWKMQLVDLGDIIPGKTVEDTYFAIRQVTAELVKAQVIPLVIGGSQDLTYAMYQGYEALEQMINVMSIDHKLDLGEPDEEISKDAYVNKLLMHRPCFLFNYATLGYQTPLVKHEQLDLFNRLYFDAVRLGEFNADFKSAEPLLRNTDLLSIDLQAIRASDFAGKYFHQPNGFFNHEICQLAKYAGISDKLTAIGIFNCYFEGTTLKEHQQIAQIMWYFIEGVSQRFGDFPVGSKKAYTKFTVYFEKDAHEIIFYKSNVSARWWMEVPYPPVDNVKFERHHMVPCNKEDYDFALVGEIPDLWWKTYQKLG